ncbi:expressed unknown protein [Seminavis robusta]|uniref:Uncharacterized protein n=1 Tax=Seminavis robusta TaxID=568900 RepID=A0A9N8EMQ4_9STRA|nr:expressed unknown protein [Seminavis robusta]|eukprot:Sro1427_g271800.1 n/a (400) ;mRNA; f:10292-11491
MTKKLNYALVSIFSCALTYVSVLCGFISLPTPQNCMNQPSRDKSHQVVHYTILDNREEETTLLGKLPMTQVVQESRKASTSTSYKTTKTTTQHQNANKFHSRLRFVMVVGLEGTGHHFMGQVIKESPIMETLSRLKLAPTKLKLLDQKLFNHINATTGLWNAHCATEEDEPPPDLTHTLKLVVKYLKEMERLAKMNANTNNTIHVPLNTAVGGVKGFGQVSYPNFKGDCRKLNYPSLDLLYRACDMAKVDCGHVYIYRNPAAILQSTTRNRKYSSRMLEQIHLYKSMYHIITAEFVAFPERTLGCFGLLESNNGNNNKAWWKEMAPLWGWNSKQLFYEYMESIYRPPRPIDQNFTELLTSRSVEPYMHSLNEVHQKVIQVCQKAKAGQLEAISTRQEQN